MSRTSDVHSIITDKIIADLEQGQLTWVQPWLVSSQARNISRPLRSCGTPYTGINVISLWISAMQHGYGNASWFTYRQACALGAQVRKGEKGTPVIYANSLTQTFIEENGEENTKTIPFVKCYKVFNLEQIDGLPERYQPTEPMTNGLAPIENLERFFDAIGARIEYGGDIACYEFKSDRVKMPPLSVFADIESYYATLSHELVHWTAHSSRLGRNVSGNRFGDAGYAMEELVAEIGAAFLCADLQITPVIREDHAAYIATWLKVLKSDKRAIFTAAAQAQRAVDYLHGFNRHNNYALG